MHFYLIALKIVPPNACVQNTNTKKLCYHLSSTFSSFFTQLRYTMDIQSYTKFLPLKPLACLCKALGMSLCCTFTKIKLPYIAKNIT